MRMGWRQESFRVGCRRIWEGGGWAERESGCLMAMGNVQWSGTDQKDRCVRGFGGARSRAGLWLDFVIRTTLYTV